MIDRIGTQINNRCTVVVRLGSLSAEGFVSVIEPSPAARENQRILVESEQWSVCGKFDLSIKILHENCIDTARGAAPSNPAGGDPLDPP